MFCQKCGTQNPDNGRFCRSCGQDLGNLAPPPVIQQSQPEPEFYLDHKGRKRSNNPDDLWAQAIRNTVMGVGFIVVALALFLTNVANGHTWWWAMLFPAFGSLASGVSMFAKVRRIEQKRNAAPFVQNQFPAGQVNQPLPPPAPDFAPSATRSGSVYDTGEFDTRPPSVTEGTTRHLEINKEGETMTLPKNDL